MVKSSFEKIEEMAESLTKGTSFETVKSLMYHAEFVYDECIKPDLKDMETAGKKAAVKKFDHYNTVLRNIIATMYIELFGQEDSP